MGCCESVECYDDLIHDFIMKDVSIRRERGGSIDLATQLKNERIEIILMGCLESKLPNMEILIRDQKIPNANYRPDLIFKLNGNVYYVEIDEHKHSGYDQSKEEMRAIAIRDYCIRTYGSYRLIRFNPNEYDLKTAKNKYDAAMNFYYLISSIDGLIQFQFVH